MPSSSPKQHAFMEAIEHDPAFAARAGIKPSVGREFVAADAAGGFKPAQKSRGQRLAIALKLQAAKPVM